MENLIKENVEEVINAAWKLQTLETMRDEECNLLCNKREHIEQINLLKT